MVEVFKTNVASVHQAKKLADVIEDALDGYKVNFDLDDCDRILRVQSPAAALESWLILEMLLARGVKAEILSDDVPVNDYITFV